MWRKHYELLATLCTLKNEACVWRNYWSLKKEWRSLFNFLIFPNIRNNFDMIHGHFIADDYDDDWSFSCQIYLFFIYIFIPKIILHDGTSLALALVETLLNFTIPSKPHVFIKRGYQSLWNLSVIVGALESSLESLHHC